MKKKITLNIIILLGILTISILFAPKILNNINYGLDFKGGFEILYEVKSLNDEEVSSDMIKSTYKAIINRIDTLGVSEPEIVIEGNNIRVKLPGVQNEEEARQRLSTPAVLSFRNVYDEEIMNASVLDTPGASLDYDPNTNFPVVALKIKDNNTFYNRTKSLSESSNNTIVIWLDYEEEIDSYQNQIDTCGKDGNLKCISAATVNEGFRDNVVIQGNFTEKEANLLVDLINSGSLPTKIEQISTKTVSASLGNEIINKVLYSFIISIILITIILIFKYRLTGVITSICLLVYALLVLFIYNSIDGVLTLSGVAAMILGIGMAVDSNVISMERIKDEIKNKKTLKQAFSEGNKRSLVAILDANITTFLAALILFIFGESSVKGFATMLMVTILCTILIMVYLNRFLLHLFLKSGVFKTSTTLFLGKIKENKKKEFLGKCKYFKGTFIIIIIISTIILLINNVNLGIDFSGGSLITIKNEDLNKNKIKEVIKDYEITNEETSFDNEISYTVKKVLQKEEINEIKDSLKEYDVNIESISNIVKKDLTKNALISLLFAAIIIVIYVALRFNFNFGISAIITLIYDLLVVIAFFIIFNIEINFIFIAAMLTIIGYSINDTIVLFDRIRENKKFLYKNNIKDKEELKDLINLSSSQTISRNIWTSITTISTLLVLMFMSINEIYTFNIALLIGLISGSISSLFIAPYLYYSFEKRSIKNTGKRKKYEDELDEKIIEGIND